MHECILYRRLDSGEFGSKSTHNVSALVGDTSRQIKRIALYEAIFFLTIIGMGLGEMVPLANVIRGKASAMEKVGTVYRFT